MYRTTIMPRSSWRPKYMPREGDGCILWLPGQDDPQSAILRDRSGYVNNGTITGATWRRTGKGLWYLYCDGTDDKITIPDAAHLSGLTGGFTIALWYASSDVTAVTHTLVSKYAAGNREWYLGIRGDSAGVRAYVYDESANAYIGQLANAAGLLTGNWTHYTMTYNGGTTGAAIVVYKNGASVATVADDNGVFVAVEDKAADVVMAMDVVGGYMQVSEALIRMYNRALSAVEIANIYRLERHHFGV